MTDHIQLNERLRLLVQLALEEDLQAAGDVTSGITLQNAGTITGRITAKAEGIIAGLMAVQAVYAEFAPSVTITRHVEDGDRVSKGTPVCDVNGDARSVLAGERTALNFLQRLSGVATKTRRFVDAVSETNAVILDTRKTTPGWRLLEKYAVRMGGGQNHRMGLYDMVLIKDNHIDAAGGITPAIRAAQTTNLPIVVEVKDLDELREALTHPITRVLLDNMTDEHMREAVAIAAGKTPLEASGGMTLERVRAVAQMGVDYISVGALTHSAPALDLSMRLV